MIAKSVSGVKRTAPSVEIGKQRIASNSAGMYRIQYVRQCMSFLLTKERLFLLTAFVGLLVANLVMLSQNNSLGYHQINQLKSEIVQLTNANNELDLKVSELKSPTRIQSIAESKLGMVLPSSFLYKSEGTTVERNEKVTKRIVD